MADERYFNIPVQMLKQLHINRSSFFSNAFDVGLYNKAKGLEGDQRKRTRDAQHFLKVTAGDPEKSIRNGKLLLESQPCNSPFVGIETNMLFDFWKNEKSDNDIGCFAAFLAIKSILGKKAFCKTNKQLIHARMFGYVSIKDLPKLNFMNAMEKKYSLRYHMDKVLLDLQLNWHLKLYSGHQRGMCLSFDIELPELVKMVEKAKYVNRVAEFKKMKKALIEQAAH